MSKRDCKTCSVPLTATNTYGKRRECKDCSGARLRDQRYGLSRGSYEDMFADQNGVCAICGQKETHTRKGQVVALCVDHDHETGRVRALLCHACNTGIGKMQDDPSRLMAAAMYLIQHESNNAKVM